MAVFWKDVLSLTCHAMLSNFVTLHQPLVPLYPEAGDRRIQEFEQTHPRLVAPTLCCFMCKSIQKYTQLLIHMSCVFYYMTFEILHDIKFTFITFHISCFGLHPCNVFVLTVFLFNYISFLKISPNQQICTILGKRGGGNGARC